MIEPLPSFMSLCHICAFHHNGLKGGFNNKHILWLIQKAFHEENPVEWQRVGDLMRASSPERDCAMCSCNRLWKKFHCLLWSDDSNVRGEKLALAPDVVHPLHRMLGFFRTSPKSHKALPGLWRVGCALGSSHAPCAR